mgnify:CR=1 FL=1|tara:strand:- start:167 stop:376 length:210 start_codon:yes stop_codon:yes gene_type:complete
MERIVHMAQEKMNFMQPAISYIFGGGLISFSLADIATSAQSLGIILGCLVVAVRLVTDTISLYKKHFKK